VNRLLADVAAVEAAVLLNVAERIVVVGLIQTILEQRRRLASNDISRSILRWRVGSRRITDHNLWAPDLQALTGGDGFSAADL
jgi:transposase